MFVISSICICICFLDIHIYNIYVYIYNIHICIYIVYIRCIFSFMCAKIGRSSLRFEQLEKGKDREVRQKGDRLGIPISEDWMRRESELEYSESKKSHFSSYAFEKIFPNDSYGFLLSRMRIYTGNIYIYTYIYFKNIEFNTYHAMSKIILSVGVNISQ